MKKTWNTPELKTFGSVEELTQQDVSVDKQLGSGDTVTISVNGSIVSTIGIPGGGSI